MRQLPNLRAAILGSACCGKSSLLHRLAYGEFQEYSVASLGSEGTRAPCSSDTAHPRARSIDMVHLECFQERWVVHDTSGLLAARAIAFGA